MNKSIEYQQAVLGLLMVYDEVSDKIVSVSEEDFEGEFKAIYKIMREVYNQYGFVDRIKVIAQLDKNQKDIIIYCAEIAVAPSMIDDYIECLKEVSSKRRLSHELFELIADDDYDCTVENVQNIIDKERDKQNTGGTEQKAQANADKFLDGLLKEKQLIKTGFSNIDFAIKGIEKGTFFIIGARPSTGKTTFALNIVRNQAKQKRRSLVFSLEMTANMIFERMMSDILSINYSDFQEKKELIDKTPSIEKQINSIREQVMVLDDVYTVENICSRIMEVKPDVAVVDFLQNVQTVKSFMDERTKINYISAELKRTAKKTGTVVIALSQMTRTGKDAPTMSDLRESGALEQDGDYIIILHRPYVIDKTIGDMQTTDVLFDKNKFGWTGKFKFNFDGAHQRFTGVLT